MVEFKSLFDIEGQYGTIPCGSFLYVEAFDDYHFAQVPVKYSCLGESGLDETISIDQLFNKCVLTEVING